jgi:cob(I)alamin adenosyltransferase
MTQKDLHLKHKQETGEYPDNVTEDEYIKWLEDWVLHYHTVIEELKSEIITLKQI